VTFQRNWDVGAVSRRDLAETARAIADGKEALGDMLEARRLRARAREIEFRDGWKGVRARAKRQGEEDEAAADGA
jgi:hypothetical protein